LHYFDHVAVLVDQDFCLQVGPPKARLIESYLFLTFNRKPFILRPDPAYKEEFLRNVKNLEGVKYNFLKALMLWASISVYEKSGVAMSLEALSGDKVICTDSILGCLPNIAEIRSKLSSLDFSRFGSHSLNDFLKLCDNGYLTQVSLPFPYTFLKKAKGSYYTATRNALKKDYLVQTFLALKDLNTIYKWVKLLGRKRLRVYVIAFNLLMQVVQRMDKTNQFQLLSSLLPKL